MITVRSLAGIVDAAAHGHAARRNHHLVPRPSRCGAVRAGLNRRTASECLPGQDRVRAAPPATARTGDATRAGARRPASTAP